MKTARPLPHREPPKGGFLFLPRRLTRSAFLKWLRRTHAWFGLWGAVFGLLFGFTGLLMNHRAVLKIPVAKLHESKTQIALPTPAPDNAQALATFLQQELHTDRTPTIKVEDSRPVPWGDGSIRQPERWQITFATLKTMTTAEYWVGNSAVAVTQKDANLFAVLMRLHMASGTGVGWVLLADTFAGGIIVLAVTGTLLWTRLHGSRLVAAGLGFGSLVLVLFFAVRAL